MLMVENKQIH